MQEALHFKGYWFTPDTPEKKYDGDLKYSPETGIELNIYGVYDLGTVELISGLTQDGKCITIYKPFLTASRASFPGANSCTYVAVYMFVGSKNFNSQAEMVFTELNCSWFDFDFWIGKYGFIKNEFKGDTKKGIIEYIQPGNIPYEVTENLKVEFRFGTSYAIGKRKPICSFEQFCIASFQSKNGPVKFETLFDWHHRFEQFMMLAYFQAPLIKKLELVTKVELPDNKLDYCRFDLYFSVGRAKSKPRERVSEYSFLFLYEDVESNFEQLLKNWYRAGELMNPTLGGLSESLTKHNHAVEFKFLNLAHSIETLHRRTKNGYVEESKVFKHKLKTIIDSTDPIYHAWLKDKLAFANERSLSERLKELIDSIPEPLHSILFKQGTEQFIRTFKNNRNFYTHYDKKSEPKALKATELFNFSERLKIFLVCLVLKEIGFTDDELIKTILKSGIQLFNHIINYEEVKEHLEKLKI